MGEFPTYCHLPAPRKEFIRLSRTTTGLWIPLRLRLPASKAMVYTAASNPHLWRSKIADFVNDFLENRLKEFVRK